MSDRLAKLIFVISGLVLVLAAGFVYGAMFVKYNLWPHSQVTAIRQQFANLQQSGQWAADGRFNPAPPNASRKRVTIYDAAKVQAGYRVIMAANIEGHGYVAAVIDEQGKPLFTTPLSYADISGHTLESSAPHGMKMLPDGSVLVLYDGGDLLARVDACGEAMWTRTGHFNHSIERAADGNYWSWRGAKSSYDQYQYMVKFNPDTGETVTELGLVGNVIKASDTYAALFQIPDGFKFVSGDYKSNSDGDIFHPNDVEELQPTMAEAFPEFSPGDLLISIRNINMVAVVDPTTYQIKWWRQGPWHRQHDADFEPDGRIWVFNNNRDRQFSDLVSIDPRTDDVSVLPSTKKSRFYSATMGKHQLLPNGNHLITVPHEGRVLEVSPKGELVWSFNNVLDEKYNGHVPNAEWLPADYFTDPRPDCS